MPEITKPPKAFISYAWEDDTKLWVRDLATRLRKNGVYAILDQWDVAPGDSLPEFMESSVSASDFVLVVCTPAYKRKSDSSDPSGVGYEKGVITGELFVKRNQRKFIPILRKGKWLEAAPSWVLGKTYIDLRGKPYSENSYKELLRTIYGKRKPPPELGTPPDFSDDDDSPEKPKPFAEFFTTLTETLSETFTRLKSNLSKAIPFVRIAGFIGIIAVLFWAGSWAIRELVPLIPTPKATLTPTKNVIATTESTSLPTEITDSKGVSMMLVSAGEFIMGSNNTSTDEKPMQHVFLDAFYIDKNEVTNALYKACVTSGGCSPPRQIGSRTHTHYYDNPIFDNYPVVYVDWDQADTYCKWRGGKLPTESQWEKAARGTDGFIYPWGNEFDGGPANFCDRNCTFDIANMDFNDGYNDTAPVGNYRGGKSVYGVYDLAGNVWEWVADWYSATYYQYLPLSNPFNDHESQYRVVRGGGWNNILEDLRGTNRYYSSPNDFYYYLGFRCAKDAP